MILELLQQKPLDWDAIEQAIRAQGLPAVCEAYAKANVFAAGYENHNSIIYRTTYIRRALAAVYPQGHKEAQSLHAAQGLYKPAGTPLRLLLERYFSGQSETKTHRFKRKDAEALTLMTPEELKPKIPAVPVSGSWWRSGEGFAITLQFDAQATDEQITRWFIKHMEEV